MLKTSQGVEKKNARPQCMEQVQSGKDKVAKLHTLSVFLAVSRHNLNTSRNIKT
ncbi:Hypothetical protein Cul131001_1789 [Corynebacterium ulcerans]|uniref:Transposase n=1 Tax=Corynebacterium ulcerans FRC58 TaxID=1408268 RepID=A0ABN4H409_CORUL|nr:Hypothetical protein Cul05146_1745 [Corynebacterium ulcerans]AKN77651.1 Hypothetical protein CulFRC58_1797 [Corynebacterium ulcerans FRC58]ALD95480.1 Hypothetical protein Cul131001_1789 [Corynebacterium ulcerans]ESU58138.1 hypothetical protein D881_09700 [Corynebacterium ulcerans NCTC 12077]